MKTKTIQICFFLLAVFFGSDFAAGTGPDPMVKGYNTLSDDNLRRHVETLASDEFGGRDTPSPGLNRAAAYIADHFKKIGLEPGGLDGSFQRHWDWTQNGTSESAALVYKDQDSTVKLKAFERNRDFVVVEGSPEGTVVGEPMFLGYGIEAKEFRYSDFVKARPKGKILLVFSHEPREKEKGKAFNGVEATEHSSIFEKAKLAETYGALGLLVITDPINHQDAGPIHFHFRRGRRCAKSQGEGLTIPVLTVSLRTAEEILGEPLLPVQRTIDNSMKSHSIEKPGAELTIHAVLETKSEPVPNVVGIRKGSDPTLAEEYVVLGAHFDHVGMDDRGVVWNGADDNASGTATLMEIAAAFAETQTPRSLVFVAFSGEEIGLKGSEAFVRFSPVSTENMIAMLNMDMIGRGDPGELFVVGLKNNREMESVLKKAAKRKRFPIRVEQGQDARFFQRSDQYNFVKAGIPALFFMAVNNEHEDYHCPSDTSDKIQFKKLEKVAKVIYTVAFELAAAEEKPKRIPTSK